jgi:uncharacterized protein (DUF362 family)/NAD-dependent dihydropyrimidine dehydrogenase PreA subunit
MERSIVALVNCGSYDDGEVLSAVKRGIGLLGGIGCFVKQKDETILLKPNALNASDPAKCVITHPAVFRAVCTLFAETGCSLTYGDSPALYSGWGKCGPTMKKCGYMDIARKAGVSMADFDNGEPVSHAAGVSRKVFVIANGVLAADGIVSLPKFKTHALTRITGAVKNQYGCVPGMFKGRYHASFPDVNDFSRLVADITAFVRPRLYIMDAVMAMEGNGPQSGDPRKLGLLLLSRDPVALDAVAARIVGLAPEFVPTCTAGEKAGLGTFDFEKIDCVGDDLQRFAAHDFKVPRQPPVASGGNPLTRAIRSAVTARPTIDPRRCTRCGVCIKTCPVDPKAIGWKKRAAGDRHPPEGGPPYEGGKPPSYRYHECIRCFCCHECCPSRAIVMHTPFLGRFLPVLSYLSLLVVNLREKMERRRQRS